MRLNLLPLAALFAAALVPAAPAAAASPIFGRWLTDDRTAVIRVGQCGASLCGMIERVLDPKAPTSDLNNPDPARRGRALVGTMVLTGFSPSRDGWAGGRVYDPKGGRSYRSQLAIDPDGRLQVTGCLMMICRSRYWTRAG